MSRLTGVHDGDSLLIAQSDGFVVPVCLNSQDLEHLSLSGLRIERSHETARMTNVEIFTSSGLPFLVIRFKRVH